MLLALVVMAGVLLLVMVVNNRRQPSRWTGTTAARDGTVEAPEMPLPGHTAVSTRAVIRAVTVARMRVVGAATGVVVEGVTSGSRSRLRASSPDPVP